ncbi:hypothetical protein OS493_027020 [Desmophyllum pertusum]|uniref:Uncharacterized protein n=1 Tax=Desmophyllum pertusum TaxID=174260 RepID=A0A9X0CJ58_9CNID|nr:hypothetical protein OS493_027020 [Desmophyllum pertusum]
MLLSKVVSLKPRNVRSYCSNRIGSHKESGGPRKIRDEMDVQKNGSSHKRLHGEPFELAWEEEEPAPLLNILTGVVMPPEKADQRLGAKQKETARVTNLRSKGLTATTLAFGKNITKANVTMFSSLSKKVKIRRAEEKKVTDRRQKLVWSRTSRGKEPSHRLEEGELFKSLCCVFKTVTTTHIPSREENENSEE